MRMRLYFKTSLNLQSVNHGYCFEQYLIQQLYPQTHSEPISLYLRVFTENKVYILSDNNQR